MSTLTASQDSLEPYAQASGAPEQNVAGVIAAIRNAASLSQLLRILGAAVIVASMSLFLLQGWHDGNDTMRYLKLLAQTGLLGLGGLALSYGLKEAKGARVFFGLALVSVPANFTILGALIYSLIQLDGGLTTYPAFATWEIGNVSSIALTTLGAIAVLVPVSRFCFAVMARNSARTLTLHFAALNLLLLVPARLPVVASGVALVGTLYAFWAIRRLRPRDPALTTAEGRFALTALFIPVGIVLVRSLMFYDVDALTVAVLSTTTYFALRYMAMYPGRRPPVAAALDGLSLPAGALTSLALMDAIPHTVDVELMLPFGGLVVAAFGFDVLLRSPNRGIQHFAAFAISAAVGLGFALPIFFSASAFSVVAGLVAAAVLMLLGTSVLGRSGIAFGALIGLTTLWLGFDAVLDVVSSANWITWAVLGASAILLGSVIERHGAALRLRTDEWMRALNARREAVLDD